MQRGAININSGEGNLNVDLSSNIIGGSGSLNNLDNFDNYLFQQNPLKIGNSSGLDHYQASKVSNVRLVNGERDLSADRAYQFGSSNDDVNYFGKFKIKNSNENPPGSSHYQQYKQGANQIRNNGK